MMREIAERLKIAKNIAIFTHTNPDGDALGSSFAMKYVLESLGKKATIYLETEIPKQFSYLGNDYVIFTNETETDADTALVLDCATFARLGTLAEFCSKIQCILCVDHHYSGENFGHFCYKESDSAATAQIVYRLACYLIKDIPLTACEAMYTGISTDTGHFKFSNVTSETFFVASELLKSGMNHRKITEILYDTVKHEKLVFLGRAAEKIEFFFDGKIAVIKVPEDFLAEYDLTYHDVEELPNLALSVEGVQVAILVKDGDEGKKRVSLRGKDACDLSSIANEFGGGGHKNASAFVADGKIDEVLRILIYKIIKGLGEAGV